MYVDDDINEERYANDTNEQDDTEIDAKYYLLTYTKENVNVGILSVELT